MVWAGTIAALILLFVVYQYFVQNAFVTEHVNVTYSSETPGLDSVPKKILLISDLHGRRFGEKNERLIKEIRSIAPEIVLIPGDLFVGRSHNVSAAVEFVKELCALGIPVYYSLGNHESGFKECHPAEYESYLETIQAPSLHVLDNRGIFADEKLFIAGLTIPNACYRKDGRSVAVTAEDIAKIEPSIPEDAFTILLAHTPYYFTTYAMSGAKLVVSGHVHGGIVRLPLLGGVISPQMEWFPKYDSGIYRENDCVMAVTRGLGAHTIPIRVGNRPQLMVLHIDSV
ncbi:MAG: metallophosphoesterase [Lachnospiraceae bacterium]|nr:metallophosphoesterase [Lachnospiraceae bacterium]